MGICTRNGPFSMAMLKLPEGIPWAPPGLRPTQPFGGARARLPRICAGPLNPSDPSPGEGRKITAVKWRCPVS